MRPFGGRFYFSLLMKTVTREAPGFVEVYPGRSRLRLVLDHTASLCSKSAGSKVVYKFRKINF